MKNDVKPPFTASPFPSLPCIEKPNVQEKKDQL